MLPPDPGEFVGGEGVSLLLRELRLRADVVLVDTSPLLSVSDAVTLSGLVDGMLLIVRSDVARRDELREFRRVLSNTQAEKLGFVLTGDSDEVDAGSYYTHDRRG